MIGWLKTNVIMLGACAAVSGVLYLKGRSDAAEKCAQEKAAAAIAANEAKEEDNDRQAGQASADSDRLRREIARLNRQLELTHVPTGLVCDAPGSGDSVLDAHSQLFGTGLPPLAGGDGE